MNNHPIKRPRRKIILCLILFFFIVLFFKGYEKRTRPEVFLANLNSADPIDLGSGLCIADSDLGVFYWQGQHLYCLDKESPIAHCSDFDTQYPCKLFASDRYLWLQTSEGQLWRMNPKTCQSEPVSIDLSDFSLYCCIDGQLVIYRQWNYYLYDEETLERTLHLNEFCKEPLEDKNIALPDSDISIRVWYGDPCICPQFGEIVVDEFFYIYQNCLFGFGEYQDYFLDCDGTEKPIIKIDCDAYDFGARWGSRHLHQLSDDGSNLLLYRKEYQYGTSSLMRFNYISKIDTEELTETMLCYDDQHQIAGCDDSYVYLLKNRFVSPVLYRLDLATGREERLFRIDAIERGEKEYALSWHDNLLFVSVWEPEEEQRSWGGGHYTVIATYPIHE